MIHYKFQVLQKIEKHNSRYISIPNSETGCNNISNRITSKTFVYDKLCPPHCMYINKFDLNKKPK